MPILGLPGVDERLLGVIMSSLKIIQTRSLQFKPRLCAVVVITNNSSTKRLNVFITCTHMRAADGSDVRKAVGALFSSRPEKVKAVHNVSHEHHTDHT